MGKITCGICGYDRCRDSCLDRHKPDYGCHNERCPLHEELSLEVRDGKLLRRRREAEIQPHRSSYQPRPSSGRPGSSSRRRSGDDNIFSASVMDSIRREVEAMQDAMSDGDSDDDDRGRGPSRSARVGQGSRPFRPDDRDDRDDSIRRGTRYVQAPGSDDDERRDTGRPSSSRRYPPNSSSSRRYGPSSSTRPPPADYPRSSSRRRSPGPSSSRPSSSYYPSGGSSGPGPFSSYSGRNDRGDEYSDYPGSSSRRRSPPSPRERPDWKFRK
ncbi:hypothetical protein QBC39DRAFT_354460 [Podospora conica]|nr:hypothetical protein QBC39DRAFT_354460 [Schizothecium conicum]